MAFEPILLKYCTKDADTSIDFYLSHGGYDAAKKALQMTPDDLIAEVKNSGLRGRGGAGFPTGMKWGFVPKDVTPTYLVCNADESEPGTFKDRQLINGDPHALIEGMIIGSWAIRSNHAFIYIRGEMGPEAQVLEKAIDEANAKGFLGKGIFDSDYDLQITITRGAGAYICGEETSLLTSLEGNRGYPRLKPPFPAVKGLWGQPTIVNNVETLMNLPPILNNGADWYRSFGTEKSPGFKVFSVSGHVEKPSNYEVPLGTPLMELINDYAGGPWKGIPLKAIIPGGSSVPVMPVSDFEVNLDYESITEKGSMLGSGGVIVMNENTCMVNAILNLIKFYHHESCGQCTPCREGTGWLEKIIHRIAEGHGREEDLALLDEIGNNMVGNTICVLADAAVMPIQSFLKHFRDEFEYLIKHKKSKVASN